MSKRASAPVKRKTREIRLREPGIKTIDLLDLDQFIYYCEDRGLDKLEKSFFEELIKERFLIPILVDKSGAAHFSPFQIAIVALLRRNCVQDGILRYPELVCTRGSVEIPCIDWPPLGRYVAIDETSKIHEWIDDFHNFLLSLHNLPVYPPYAVPMAYQGYFHNSPTVGFDFSQITPSPSIKISESDLIRLRLGIGNFAMKIDPLSEWFHYVRRHPRWKREQLKGDTNLAQQLYDIDDLLRRFGEALFGPQKDISSLLEDQTDIGIAVRDDYIWGTDIISLKYALNKFNIWLKNDKNSDFISQELLARVHALNAEVEHFIQKFGQDYYSANSYSYTPKAPASITLEDLPVQHRTMNVVDEHGNRSIEEKDVAEAIYHYMYELQRLFIHAVSLPLEELRKKSGHLHHQRDMNQSSGHYSEELDAKLRAEMFTIDEIEKRIYEIQKISQRVLCCSCRKNPVLKLDRYNQSDNLLCDECIDQRRELALSRDEGDRKAFKKEDDGIWHCDGCGTILQKFLNRNIFISEGLNGNMPVATLKYGEIEMEATCKKPECGYKNRKTFHYGWEK